MQWYFPITNSGKIQSSVGPLHPSYLLKYLPTLLFGVPPPFLILTLFLPEIIIGTLIVLKMRNYTRV